MYIVTIKLNKAPLPSSFISHSINKCLTHGLFNAWSLSVLCVGNLRVGDFIKMATKFSAEALFSVPKSKKAFMCLTEKIHVT